MANALAKPADGDVFRPIVLYSPEYLVAFIGWYISLNTDRGLFLLFLLLYVLSVLIQFYYYL